MNDDITTILYRIKENIKLVESGDRDDALFDDIRSDFLEMLELIKLFMISERDTYYGFFLMNLQFSANFNTDCIAGIKLNTFPPVLDSNPLLLCKFKLKEIIYVICHEIDHVVFNHPAEMVKANPTGDEQTFYEFNLAADAAVNDRINYEIRAEKHHFMSPPDGLITSEVLSKMYDLGRIHKMENYAYYFDLIQSSDRKSEMNPSSGNGQERIFKQFKIDNVSGDESSDGEKGEFEDGDPIVCAGNWDGTLNDHNWETGDDAVDIESAVRELVNSSFSMMSEESRGLMPAFFISQVEKINAPAKITWQSVLKKYVGTISAGKRATRTRLNRRQPERFDLSGRVDEKILKIVVAIDTSASVSDEMVSEILSEIFAILAKRKHEVTIIECDAEVQRVYKARNISEVKKSVIGRGGTRFTPVIEYVNSDRYFRDALLIYFTDGYGEFEIPKPKTYRNMWVVLGDPRNLSVKESYGVVLSI